MSRLYTEIRGTGPALVLLHGWGLNVRVWDGLAAALCDRFRIIPVDLPGHGRSVWLPERSSLEQQAAQVAETVAAITAEYSLLGWSLGGQIALQLAAAQCAAGARPPAPAAAVDRLVLIATTPRLTAGPGWPHGAPPERLAAQADGLETDYRRTVSDFLELQVRGSADSAETLEQLRAALFAHGYPGLAALARGLDLLRETDLRPLLAGITLPTLVIAGQYDRVTMPAASHALVDSLPDARYVEIRRAAHAPFLSHLPELSALISDFLLPA
ncbi:MAG TPA: alpha/beta fold hydrolase [Steroidobacteraceae bacterium]|jgi:pimeloyl-[acyl-carrier protein] methyl ester esterase|nr:alpha/beta fold hydrolase [Steroidobacteraceae bacterium]